MRNNGGENQDMINDPPYPPEPNDTPDRIDPNEEFNPPPPPRSPTEGDNNNDPAEDPNYKLLQPEPVNIDEPPAPREPDLFDDEEELP